MTYIEYILILIILGILLFHHGKEIYQISIKHYNNWRYPVNKIKVRSILTNVNRMKRSINVKLFTFIDELHIEPTLRKMVKDGVKGGKRLRPIITLSIFKKLNNLDNIENIPEYILNMAHCMEITHCTSLILDDIMDRDLERRGVECIYKKYGETNSLILSLYMMTLVWKIIMKTIKEADLSKELLIILTEIITENMHDLTMGEYFGSQFPDKTNIDLQEIIHKKTSSLFELCFIIPFIFHNKNKNIGYIKNGLKTIGIIARHFGMIYQIADDFEDVCQDIIRDGKDKTTNYVIINGINESKMKYENEVNSFEKLTEEFGIYSNELKEIINYLNTKVKVNFDTNILKKISN